MPGNNPNSPKFGNIYNNGYTDPGNLSNGSVKPRLTIKIPNSNSNNSNNSNNPNNSTNTKITDDLIEDIEVAQDNLIDALNNDDDTAAQYADVLDLKLVEFYKLIKNTNNNYKNSATKHVEKIIEYVKSAIENFKKRSIPETKMNLFKKLMVKRKNRKTRKN